MNHTYLVVRFSKDQFKKTLGHKNLALRLNPPKAIGPPYTQISKYFTLFGNTGCRLAGF